MSINKTILGMITDKATNTFPNIDVLKGSEDILNNPMWHDWERHWLKTADEIHAGFVSEGLEKTAESVRNHIEFQKKHMSHLKVN